MVAIDDEIRGGGTGGTTCDDDDVVGTNEGGDDDGSVTAVWRCRPFGERLIFADGKESKSGPGRD